MTPDETLLVVDAMTGQEAATLTARYILLLYSTVCIYTMYEYIRLVLTLYMMCVYCRFNDDIGITGAILTKLDGDTRGGSALSVRGVNPSSL